MTVTHLSEAARALAEHQRRLDLIERQARATLERLEAFETAAVTRVTDLHERVTVLEENVTLPGEDAKPDEEKPATAARKAASAGKR